MQPFRTVSFLAAILYILPTLSCCTAFSPFTKAIVSVNCDGIVMKL